MTSWVYCLHQDMNVEQVLDVFVQGLGSPQHTLFMVRVLGGDECNTMLWGSHVYVKFHLFVCVDRE
jgi:hypothetical protein